MFGASSELASVMEFGFKTTSTRRRKSNKIKDERQANDIIHTTVNEFQQYYVTRQTLYKVQNKQEHSMHV